jgi:hypothetical protein
VGLIRAFSKRRGKYRTIDESAPLQDEAMVTPSRRTPVEDLRPTTPRHEFAKTSREPSYSIPLVWFVDDIQVYTTYGQGPTAACWFEEFRQG